MAEIYVQSKKQSLNSVWIWILIALLAISAIVYFGATKNNAGNTIPASQPDAASELSPQPKAGPHTQDGPVYVPVVYMRSV